jgi:RHS repeat-associated protein
VSNALPFIPTGNNAVEIEKRKGWQQLELALKIIPAFTPTKNQVKAYIQIIVFDKDYQYIRSEKKIVSKASLDNCGELLEIAYTMPTDGYVQVMTVNESPNQSVWFDDIELLHEENLITQETHYDAFGLELKGIEKIGKPEHRWKFTGKESIDDLDLGWDDFRARQYDSQLGRWWQIDPLADKMRRHSPYNYAFNNPLRFIDPDGMAPCDLYDQQGNKVATDNKADDKKYVVTDKETVKSYDKTKGVDVVEDASKVTSATLLPSNAALKEASDVIDRTGKNGGLKEENSLVMKDGTVVKGQTGSEPTIVDNMQTANATLPSIPAGKTTADVEATIHSHPTKVQVVGTTAYPQSATLPSDADRSVFKQYGTNIIVGRLGQSTVTANPDGTLNFNHKPLGAVIYDKNTQPIIQLTQKAIQKILK